MPMEMTLPVRLERQHAHAAVVALAVWTDGGMDGLAVGVGKAQDGQIVLRNWGRLVVHGCG